MMHNYKLEELRKDDGEAWTDISDVTVSLDLRYATDMPLVLKKRIENTINTLIDECENKRGVEMPAEDIDLSDCMRINTDTNELEIDVYIGYSLEEDSIYSEEVISADDKDYPIIKEYYGKVLNDCYFSHPGQMLEDHG